MEDGYMVKNENIQVCPHCGSTRHIKYVRKYKLIKSGRQGHHDKHILREHSYHCRRCNKGFNRPDNLQEWLMQRFNEARANEQLA